MLEASHVEAGYGHMRVLHDVELSVQQGETVAIVGANGAGKSTLLHVLAGVTRPSSGEVRVDGEAPARWSARAAVSHGVVLVPEGRHVFAQLSVRDNLLLGGYRRRRKHQEISQQMETVVGLFPVIGARLNAYAGILSGGQQQMLAIGRGLMANPTYLLLDEPSLGLAPIVVSEIFERISLLAASGVAVLLAEQNGRAALELAARGYLVEQGSITLTGTGAQLLAHPEITDRVLGATGSGPSNTGLGQRIRQALTI